MQTNNNPLAEILVFAFAALLLAIGGVLLFFGKIDTNFAGYFFVSALGVVGYNAAFKAPSPTQQAALLQLTAQALSTQAQPAQLVQAPAPVATPQGVNTGPTSYSAYLAEAGTRAMPQAIQTTMANLPIPGKPQ